MRIVALAPDGRAALQVEDYIVSLDVAVRFGLGVFGAATTPRDLLADNNAHAAGRELHRTLTALDDVGLGELLQDGFAQPSVAVKLVAPVRPQTLIRAGIKGRRHSGKAGYLKTPAAVIGPDEDVMLPADTDVAASVDCEGELCVVIGTTAHQVNVDEALSYVGGYTCGIDVSTRNDVRYAMLGPCIATRDEFPEFGDVPITTRVDGRVRRNAVVSDLIVNAAEMVSYWSHVYALQPGDVISSCSPSRVSKSRRPLQPGCRVEVEIPRIGVLSSRVVAQ
jgi:Fumarylacetoacetate (FAA) hydrolase family